SGSSSRLLHINEHLSHAVIRFGPYFGLRPPCLLCSRINRLFGAKNDHRAAGEISGMGYYLHHQRVAAAVDMCGGCLSAPKEMTKDAEETCSVVCSCCKALVQISSSCELE
ncbi:hypothetical protein CFC21_098748, partial [Triticum aestivum]